MAIIVFSPKGTLYGEPSLESVVARFLGEKGHENEEISDQLLLMNNESFLLKKSFPSEKIGNDNFSQNHENLPSETDFFCQVSAGAGEERGRRDLVECED